MRVNFYARGSILSLHIMHVTNVSGRVQLNNAPLGPWHYLPSSGGYLCYNANIDYVAITSFMIFDMNHVIYVYYTYI